MRHLRDTDGHSARTARATTSFEQLLRAARDSRRLSAANVGPEMRQVACAARQLDKLLSRRLAGPADASVHFTRVASLAQMSLARIGTLMTSIADISLEPQAVMGLAVALVEILHFIDAGVPADGNAVVQLAMVPDGDLLIVGVAALEDFSPIASARATCALQRAAAITRLLGGDFQRGVDEDRMIFGLTFEGGIGGCG